MYKYEWDAETGGLLLLSDRSSFSKEPRPVYSKELDILGFDQFWRYPKDDSAPLLWAEANNYYYKGRNVARTKGGSLYTKPEIILLDDPEPSGAPMQFVDVPAMCRKNHALMDALVQETIKNAYNAYLNYMDKVDAFHVSYSGGKDSEVLLDIIQRALPHNAFKVIFGDTGMEFPDTYEAVEHARNSCEKKNIDFYIAKAKTDPIDNWRIFGPPSKTIRWCCSVHKTTPQNLLLRDLFDKSNFTEMAFVGIRGDESIKRSGYDYISIGTKHKGQYSCNPLLEWNSAEIYLYIFDNNLWLNKTYKKGNARAGCLVCPMTGERQDYFRRASYQKEVDKFIDIIREMSAKDFPTEKEMQNFIVNGDWKARNNGRDIRIPVQRYKEVSSNTLEITKPLQDWQEWLKTVGNFDFDGSLCTLGRNNETYKFTVEKTVSGYKVFLNEDLVKRKTFLTKAIKNVFRKAANCIGCQECQADCPYGCLSFVDGKVKVSSSCRKCMNCHKIDEGCLVYKSLQQPKGNGKMKNMSIDSYADHAPKLEWIQSFFELKDDFPEKHTLGSMMYDMFRRFLRDAELLENNQFSETAKILDKIGLDSPKFWGILLVNLSYAPEIGWFIHNIKVDSDITRSELFERLKEAGCSNRGASSVSRAYKRILSLPFGDLVGLGKVLMDGNTYLGLHRGHWLDPIPEVILYALYKFAEACGEYYQFSLQTLLDDGIERDGVSPTRIFGLSRDTMVRILNGLTINYPEFISASFTLDLDNITLRSDKTADDVLQIL